MGQPVFASDILARDRPTGRPSQKKDHLVRTASTRQQVGFPVALSAFVTLTVAGTAGALHSASLKRKRRTNCWACRCAPRASIIRRPLRRRAGCRDLGACTAHEPDKIFIGYSQNDRQQDLT